MGKVLIDTNVLLDGFQIEEGITYVLLSHVNRELEKHKTYGNEELKFKARQAVRFIEDNKGSFYFDIKDYKATFEDGIDDQYTDNKIVQACLDNKYKLMTNDVFLRHKAEAYGVEIIKDNKQITEHYSGYKIYKTNDANSTNTSDIYEGSSDSMGLLTNNYLILTDKDDKEIGCLKWNGERFVRIDEINIKTDAFGSFKCKDMKQKAVIDSLINNDLTVIKGKAGTGKSLIALSYAIDQLEKGKIKKLVIFSNPISVRGSSQLGYYSGDKNEKLLQNSIGNLLLSKFGSLDVIEEMIFKGSLLILPIGDIRGFESGSKSIIYISEAQNLSSDLMKLAVQRLSSGSKMIIDGDNLAQVDSSLFAGSNNGMTRLSEVFRGSKYYGEVELTKIYRSAIAEIADKM